MTSENSVQSSEWIGLRGQIMARYLNSPLRRLSEILFLGNIHARVLYETVSSLKAEGIVLDVGAGSGYFSLAIARKLERGKVICMDLSREMLQSLWRVAKKKGLTEKVELMESSAYEIKLANNSVDLAIANGVFHELANPPLALQEMVRVVRPTGRVIITDFRSGTWVGNRIGRAHRTEDHGPFSQQETMALFLGAGLQNIKVSVVRNFIIGVGTKRTGNDLQNWAKPDSNG
ncbi:MAG: class I SAM-dependent methyltransferase [Chloroflexi bacterium]|nr:class I SAM-dependent methyltransferase [Chloroflexota bacterium]